jgi:hypothetical protein
MRSPRAPIDRDEQLKDVQNMVGVVRQMFITNIVGQEMIYLRKEQEARAFLADPSPNLNNYPFVKADTVRFKMAPKAAAQQIVAKADLFIKLAQGMEELRGKAEDAIAGATNLPEALAAKQEAKNELNDLIAPYGKEVPDGV